MCGHGERAMTGASLLEPQPAIDDVAVLDGGPDDWRAPPAAPLETAMTVTDHHPRRRSGSGCARTSPSSRCSSGSTRSSAG